MSISRRFWSKPQAPHSKVKSDVVAKYFDAWAHIMTLSKEKVAYLDLFCGPGHHTDGTPSTPIKVLDSCSRSPKLVGKVSIIFNDQNPKYVEKLERFVEEKGYLTRLKNQVKFSSLEVSEHTGKSLGLIKLRPTLCFIDPYGYKGLSQNLLGSVLKDYGCDLVVFFHTSGINRNLFNPSERQRLVSVFGERRFAILQRACEAQPKRRGEQIIGAFRETALEAGAKFVLPLRFNFPNKRLLSHHLVFLVVLPV